MSGATIVWFRQDLRLTDHPALRWAAERGGPVIPVYIGSFEEEGRWAPGGAQRWWLHQSLGCLSEDLEGLGSRLVLREGEALGVIEDLIKETGADGVCWHRRYEPAAIERDTEIKKRLKASGVDVETFKGELLYEPWEIMNQQDKPYQVYTPFSKRCFEMLEPDAPLSRPRSLKQPEEWPQSVGVDDLRLMPTIEWYQGIAGAWTPGERGALKRLRAFSGESSVAYSEDRDRPDLEGTSRLSPHLHFGEVSPRQVWHVIHDRAPQSSGKKGVLKYIKEVLWREFGYHLLYHFPSTPESPLREKYADFPWREDAGDLGAWQRGRTGYPIVDAGMRQLWATGWMHNRVRMVVASVLVKQLLISWEEGAAWFWDTLVDADLANNTLGWQWAGGCGADAAPYFRVFNPVLQGEKFDPDGAYTRRWVPELKELPTKWLFQPWEAPERVLEEAGVVLGETYPEPLIDPKAGRERALSAFDVVKGS